MFGAVVDGGTLTAEGVGMTAELCVALDGSDRRWIVDSARRLGPEVGWIKVGLEAFTAFGPELVREVEGFGASVFLDLKLHDIPNTVARAVSNCVKSGAGMLNVHAAGGREMMSAAVAAARQADPSGATKLIAVTLLTSLSSEDLAVLGICGQPHDVVARWSELARDLGLDGVVASAQEAQQIRLACGQDFLIVTPGIRPSQARGDDQRRVMTPAQAVGAGADILVVGRPITRADDPVAAARRVVAEMGT